MNYSTINTNNDSSCADDLLLNNSYDIVDDDGINMHEMLVSDGLNSCFPIDHEHLGDDDHSMPPLCRNTKMESSSVIDHYDQAGSSSTELLYGSSSMAMENESSSSTPGTHIDITKPSSSVGNGNSWVHVDRHMRPFMYPNTITTTGFGSSQQ
ncbi:hypothetical protein MKW92_018413 [Papaver armeniacum]|nr:hypothetical protein MKW92_018413 [Papaver armeniacum]